MNPKPVVLSDRALVDLAQIVRRYTSVASAEVARSFAGAIRDAVQHIALFPASGSARMDLPLTLAEVRSWPVSGFPYLLFYADSAETIDVFRVLHTARDIPESLAEGMEE